MESYVIPAPATSRQLPIDPDCQDDPFYRYKTHQLDVDFKGKRGLLVNLDLVAKNLQTSLSSWFGKRHRLIACTVTEQDITITTRP
jgi:hypothetical protein